MAKRTTRSSKAAPRKAAARKSSARAKPVTDPDGDGVVNVAGLRVASMSLRDLAIHVADWNPRSKIDGPKRASLEASLSKFGLVEPLVYNARTDTLIGGHQRVALLLERHADEDVQVPVSLVDLDEQQERTLNVALNRITGEWDLRLLGEVFRSIDKEHWLATGFEDFDITPLVRADWTPPGGDGDPPGDDDDDGGGGGGGGDGSGGGDTKFIAMSPDNMRAFESARELARTEGLEETDGQLVARFANAWVVSVEGE